MASAPRCGTFNPRFFKVPARQRRESEKAFDPWMFSFGPYHAGAACLGEGERLKRSVADSLMNDQHALDLKSLVDRITTHEEDLRDLYCQLIEPPPNLAELLARDSLLILSSTGGHDGAQLPHFMRRTVLNDALALENQLPILVLSYALQSLGWSNNPMAVLLESVRRHALELVGWSKNPPTKAHVESSCLPGEPIKDAASLLGYVYDCLTQAAQTASGPRPGQEAADENDDDCMLSTASRLARCGLRFRPCTSSFHRVELCETLWELYLPRISVSDDSLRLLHNLLAYEATSRDLPCPVASYVHVMSCLISTGEDVQVLVGAGVIENLLGSYDQLASSWRRLGAGICFASTEADHRKTTRRVETLAKKRRPLRWKAAFWEELPRLAFAAAILVLLALCAAAILVLLARALWPATFHSISGFFATIDFLFARVPVVIGLLHVLVSVLSDLSKNRRHSKNS